MLLSQWRKETRTGSFCRVLLSVLWEQLGEQSHRELGSGTGQHVVQFAQDLPFVTWQPSDIKEEFRARSKILHAGEQ
ncbi:hypothetical protein SKAU_G00295560 [Synaphobranchus kaupii]|uniref:Uncharacterized protein n=1 Tax=Synaphobranchus kaupii TaxID=118154 RepID=A0A9Q1EUQ3_SYNKA|nr:hypothetical protein SKAU_G00295560 [Synaphobranchus kaupii]